jgi:hypothetical protein
MALLAMVAEVNSRQFPDSLALLMTLRLLIRTQGMYALGV